MYTYMYMYIYLYMYMYVCMCMHMFMHAYICKEDLDILSLETRVHIKMSLGSSHVEACTVKTCFSVYHGILGSHIHVCLFLD